MTWVVGGNCFNGFVCVADIQATITYKEKREYFNCVQKIHKVYDNLCVAFSGDIKSGLLIIEDLKRNLYQSINENEYFDIDGQSKETIDYLQRIYKKINQNNTPYLELMFLWLAQEEDKPHFRPFVMKFKAPKFNMNSTAQLGFCDTGSGSMDTSLINILNFLSGKPDDHSYNGVFDGFNNDSKVVWTVKKLKKIIFNEAVASSAGVSKSFISFESEIPYKDIYSQEINSEFLKIYDELGLGFSAKKTPNDIVNVSILNNKLIDKLKHLVKNDKKRYYEIMNFLKNAEKTADFSVICKLPPIKSDYHIDNSEIIHSKNLITKWSDMQQFMEKQFGKSSVSKAIA